MQALESTDVPLAYRLEGSGLVGSLPYADKPLDKKELHNIRKLVQSEMDEQTKQGKCREIDLDDLGQDIETPCLDRLKEEGLGKRAMPAERGVTQEEYERAVIEVEQMKER